jgi:hypothetical protein
VLAVLDNQIFTQNPRTASNGDAPFLRHSVQRKDLKLSAPLAFRAGAYTPDGVVGAFPFVFPESGASIPSKSEFSDSEGVVVAIDYAQLVDARSAGADGNGFVVAHFASLPILARDRTVNCS